MNEVLHTFRQNVLNASSGILLQILRPFRTGDFIEVDGLLGSVIKKGLHQTTIANMDGARAVIDNSRFYSRNLRNLSTKNIIRLELSVGICYEEDMSRAKESILSYLKNYNKILSSPAPKLQVARLKDKYVEINIEPWCLLDDYIEIDQQLEGQLTLHLNNLGFRVDMNAFEYDEIGATA